MTRKRDREPPYTIFWNGNYIWLGFGRGILVSKIIWKGPFVRTLGSGSLPPRGVARRRN